MDNGSESSDDVFEDALDTLHDKSDGELNGKSCVDEPDSSDEDVVDDSDDRNIEGIAGDQSDESELYAADSEQDSSDAEAGPRERRLNVTRQEKTDLTDEFKDAVGDDDSDDDNQRLSVVHWSRSYQETSQSVATERGDQLSELPGPSTSGPVRPIGGSVSTDTHNVSKHASQDDVLELVGALVRRREHASDDTTVATRGDSQSDVKEVHFHLTKTVVNNPSAIALGGQVVVNPPKKEINTPKTPRPPTRIQKLRCETERNFEKWTDGMVETSKRKTVLEKISKGRTWITITGSPGEGKTTTGYLVLKHLNNQGRNVFDIKTPEDYFKVKEENQCVLMFNDIFGSLHFDIGKVKTWESVLDDILSVNEHRDEAMKGKKPSLTVILISRSSVLTQASQHLGKYKRLVCNTDSMVVLGAEQGGAAAEERMKIWKYHADKYNIIVDEKIVRDICEMSLPHGFPHCCRLFASMYSKNKTLNMYSFFSKPLEFLQETMESLMMDVVAGPLLREMLRNDGSLQLANVTNDERRFQYASSVETLSGTYLTEDEGTVTFHHPSVYDSAAFVVCKKGSLVCN